MWGDSAGSEDPRELTRSPGGVAQLGSAHGGSVRDRQVGEERMGHHVWAGQQAGWQGQRDTSLRSSTASDRTDSTVSPPQHGKAAPRVGVRGCRAFIHHTTSRHDTGEQDGVGREPVIRAEGALHATLAWAGERKQEDRAATSVALPKTPRVSPQAGHWWWEGQGQNPWRGWSRISHLHTISKFSPQIPCWPQLSPPGKCPAPLFTD